MNLRRYALGVFVSAGIAVSGVLWYQRTVPHIAGEDVAALLADAWERQVALFAYGTNALEDTAGLYGAGLPGYLQASNAVSPWRMRSRIEGAAYAIKQHFRYAPSPSYPFTGARWVWGGGLSNAADTAVVYHYPAWQVFSVSTGAYGVVTAEWGLPDPTNAAPSYATLDQRGAGPGSGVRLWSEGGDPVAQEISLPAATQYLGCPSPSLPVADYWQASGWGTNLYIWPEVETAAAGTNLYGDTVETVSYASWHIRTNALDLFRAAAGDMRRAVLVASAADPGLFSATARVDWAWSASEATGDKTNPVYYAAIDADLRAASATGAVVSVTASPALPDFPRADPQWGYRVAYVSHVGNGVVEYNAPTVWRAYSSWQAECSQWLGMSCAWPSAAVYGSGMVSRLRVYGVFRAAGDPTPVLPENLSYTLYAGDSVSTAHYAAEDLGTGYAISSLPYAEFSASSNSVSRPTDRGAMNPTHLMPAEWRLSPLADESDPAGPVLFDVGLPAIDVAAVTNLQSASYEYATAYDGGEGSSYKYDHAIYLIAVIVVADFNFSDYLQPGSPAAVHTPQWLEAP